jgi:CubicO group peptidase (beta-lactamase class C family)
MRRAAFPVSQRLGGAWCALRVLVGLCILAGGASAQPAGARHPAEVPPVDGPRAAQLDSAFPALLGAHGVATAGVGVLRGGKLVWTGYYGEQAPGVPASRGTLFNVASITKTVAAETVLRLAAAGKLSLDEPMATSWADPDVVGDARHRALTPRRALAHRTGFPNWRGRDKLAFLADPGTRFDYSGEGYDYVARFVEEKLGRPFPALVREFVTEPVGMTGISLSTPDTWVAARLALPTDDARAGQRLVPGCGTTGQFCLCRRDPRPVCRRWAVADDMVVTVEDYAAFLVSVMRGERLDSAVRAERFRPAPQQPRAGWQVADCATTPARACPTAEGWGLGWEVVDYGDRQVVTHGGADWGEVALAYFDTASRDGLIVFLNGRRPAAYRAMAAALRLLHADSPLAARYDRWGKP